MTPEQHNTIISLANNALMHVRNATGPGRQEVKAQEAARAEAAIFEILSKLWEIRL